MGKAWTKAEDKVLREYAHTGVHGVARRLKSTCGTRRTPASIQCRASRLGVTLYKHAVCPRCGRVVRRLAPVKGVCPICAAYEPTANQQRAELARAAEPTREDAQALREARRYQDRQRQRKHRM